MRKVMCLFAFLFTLFYSANGQAGYKRMDSIPVYVGMDSLDLAWAGGLHAPQFSSMDLNFDGVDDLFSFDREGNIIKTFINLNVAGESSYQYAPEYISAFPKMQKIVLLADYNCDTKPDIFTQTTGGLAVYRNDSEQSTGLKFTLVKPLIYSNHNPNMLNLYVASTDIPAICDLDNDGDLDILSFGVLGTYVMHHRNLSMENYGVCDSLEYQVVDDCWGGFEENLNNNSVTLGVSCKGVSGEISETNSAAHTGSTLLALDLDGDTDKELVMGDVSFKNLVMLTNGGDEFTASMTAQDTAYPYTNIPVRIPLFPGAYFLDVNNDNKKDFISAPAISNTGENTKGVWMYKNTNTTASPIFVQEEKGFLQNNMIETGSGNYPVFFDENGDGLLDLVIGNFGYFEAGNSVGKLTLYRNTGTVTEPKFKLITKDYLSLSASNYKGIVPSFGDMDGDGDLDMIIGDYDGFLHYYTNSGSVGSAASFSLTTTKYMGVDVGQFATPFIYDINNDGLKDLIVGERSGNLNLFNNLGTASVANFSPSPDNALFGNIDVMKPCCTGYSSVYITKDIEDKTIAYVGSEKGYIYAYSNIDGNLSGSFTMQDSIFTHSNRIFVSGGDINNDGTPELIYGEYAGGCAILGASGALTLLLPEDGSVLEFNTTILNWNSVVGVDFYQLELDTTVNFNSPILYSVEKPYISISAYNSDTEQEFFDLLELQDYYWRVRTSTNSVYSDWTEPFVFHSGISLSAKESFRVDKTIVYPNPADNLIFMEGLKEGSIIEIYDLFGRLVKSEIASKESNPVSIDCSSLSNAIYLVRLTEKENSEVHKIVIQR